MVNPVQRSAQLQEKPFDELLHPTCGNRNGCRDRRAQTFFEIFAGFRLAPDDHDALGQHAPCTGKTKQARGLRQVKIGDLRPPVLECRYGHLRDLGNQHHDGSWGSLSLDGVNDDQGSVALHELVDDPEAGDASLDELGARRQPALETPGDGKTEAVVAPKEVAHTGDEDAPPGINVGGHDQDPTTLRRPETSRLDVVG